MDIAEIDRMLEATLADGRVSRAERRALSEVFGSFADDPQALPLVRHRAFEIARRVTHRPGEPDVVTWLEDVVKLLDAARPSGTSAIAEAWFSPHDDCAARLVSLVQSSTVSLDVCVFTITDDRIARAILDAHARGVVVRIVTDNEKSEEPGSDIALFRQMRIDVRIDRSEHHMHHKFAIFDSQTLVTGSYNWTRSASEHNDENVVVTDDPRLRASFQRAFERLWDNLC
jgi:phosphatidylserine/phosphatidylglycerophosphate/cardiolipin synthase-like enzyme